MCWETAIMLAEQLCSERVKLALLTHGNTRLTGAIQA